MKRILFYTENFAGPSSKGGTEVATFRIAKALRESGRCEVYNAFRSKPPQEYPDVYAHCVQLPKSDAGFTSSLADFLSRNHIDAVVNMSRFFRHRHILNSVRKVSPDIRLLFMQHFAPGSEFRKTTWKAGRHLLSLNPFNPLYWLRASLYPLLKLPRNIRLPKIYRDTYLQSDKVILLSDKYKEEYAGIGGFTPGDKFESVPNIFESPVESGPSSLKKEKRVLILSRMDEIQKRLSLALEIWKVIEKDIDLSDWHLDIVGSGHNADIVKRLIKRLKLKNVTYHGWQDPKPFLERSSILMMTSSYEGLPLSILEAQAYGCVPVAFNSFGSLTDIVDNYENGIIVENFGDTEDYVRKLKDIMYDENYRAELSRNSIRNSSRFSPEKIAEKWLKILT